MPPVRRSSGYIPTLDGWRAIAVSLVIFAHTPAAWSLYLPSLAHIQSYGVLGVDVFFAISGLLICSRLLEEERLHGSISLKGFYIRRSFRIFPASYLYLFIVALLALTRTIPMDWPARGSALVFLRNYFTCLVRDTHFNSITGHFWSLAIEEHFYFLLPSLIVFFPRKRKHVLFWLTILCFVWLIVYLRITPPEARSIFWERRTDLRLASLLFPAWIALFLNDLPARQRLTKYLRPALIPLVLVLAITGSVAKKHFSPQPPTPAAVQVDDDVSAPRGEKARPAINFAVPILFPLFILATVLHPNNFFSRFLEWEPLRAVGRVSYSLYLWQQLFWEATFPSWPISYTQRYGLGLVFSIAVAVASYFFIEKPLIRLGHRLAPPSTAGHRDLAAPSAESLG